jgi:hypothetical protein
MRTPEDYLGLVTPWLASFPSVLPTIGMFTAPFSAIQSAAYSIQPGYDLDNALGPQLDAVGVWVGLSRFVNIPVASYFSWGTNGLGWDQANWKGPFDPSSGLVPLNDDDYRFYLEIKIALNYTNGTVGEAQKILAEAFDMTGTYVFADDNLDQTYTLAIAGYLPNSTILALITHGYISVKPFGIGQKLAITSVNGAPLFGWGVENNYIGGWGVGAWAAQTGGAAETAVSYLSDDGGVLIVANGAAYPNSPTGSPGSLWSNGGIVSIVPGFTPVSGQPNVYYGSITAQQLQTLGGAALPTSPGTTGSFQLWNNGNEVDIS